MEYHMNSNDPRLKRTTARCLATTCLLGVLVLNAIPTQGENLILNGSFETATTVQAYPDVPSINHLYLLYELPGWTLGNLLYFHALSGNGAVAQDGNAYLALNTGGYNTSNSYVSQSFPVTGGKTYRVSFYKAEEVGYTQWSDPNASVIQADITLAAGTAAGTVTQLANNLLDCSAINNWVQYTFDFLPSESTTATLTFTKVFYPHVVLDNVSVLELPTAQTGTLIGIW
jgi:hypothetical protein